jgi:hypothetical protein
MKLWVCAVGLLLVLAGIWVRAAAIGTPQPDEFKAAFTRLADVPMDLTQTGRSVELTPVIPNDEVWRRVRKRWGEPSYIVAAVSSPPENYMYCLSQLGLMASVTADGVPVTTFTADQPPYGYSANLSCKQLALRFAAAPGQHLQIAITGQPDRVSKGDRIIVEPFWTDDTKDRRVGYALVEELHLSALWRILVTLGAASTMYGFWGIVKRRAAA